MNTYYLAVDIGASSGRHILGYMEDGVIKLEEVYRFPNGMTEKNGHLCWNHDALFEEILRGLEKCRDIGKIPARMGIDTWGVDFVLLDGKGNVLGDFVGYRDERTEGMDTCVYEKVSEKELYQRTGIQKAVYNTIYQLEAIRREDVSLPEGEQRLYQAADLLMTPSYFNYLLTGERVNEYTLATTTNLVNAKTKDWDMELIEKLGYPSQIFTRLAMPGTVVGTLKDSWKKRLGFDVTVMLPGCHDTASAVLAVPAAQEDFLYISSGTWSLMGTERMESDCSSISWQENFTNEGGYGGRYRYLKNIMGLWMIQCVKKEYGDQYSFGELCELAETERTFPTRVHVDDARFLAPENMIEEICKAARESGQPAPETPGQVAAVIYQSLAQAYKEVAQGLARSTGKRYSAMHIVGGGANAGYLNQLTADVTGMTVYAGPMEATAIGNIVAQMMEDRVFASVEQARQTIYTSFGVEKFESR